MRWAFGGLLLLLLAYGSSATHRQLKSGNDFPIYLEASRDLLQHQSPYDIDSGLHGYVYLPFVAEALTPLAPLPTRAAAWIAHVANVAWVGLAIHCLAGLVGLLAPAKGGGRWILVATLLVGGRFVLDNLDTGQVNLAILALVCLSALRLLRGDARGGGLALGLAAAIKPYAVILLVPELLRGRLRPAAWAASAFVGLNLLLPLLHHGPTQTIALLEDWSQKIAVPALEGTLQSSRIWDQSPSAALRRLVVDDAAWDDRSVHVVDLGPGGFRVANTAMRALLLAGFLLVLWRGTRAARQARDELLLLAFSSCGMLTLVGYNLRSQFAVVLLPLAVGLALAWPGRAAPPLARACLAVASALYLFASPLFLGREGANLAYAWSMLTVATLSLMVGLAVLLLRAGGRELPAPKQG